MESDRVELLGTLIKASTSVRKGRSWTTLVVRAQLTVDTATALGCRDVLFTVEGEVRAGLFFSSVYDFWWEPVKLRVALDGVARREVSTELAAAGPFTIKYEAGCITVTVKLVIRGVAQSQLALLGFAMEVGDAPVICSLQRTKEEQEDLGG
jgi:hypothetical protein